MLKLLAEKITENLISTGVTLVMSVGGLAFLISFWDQIVTHIENSTPQSLAIALVALSLLSIILFIIVCYLFPSFTYNQKLQVYQHRFNGLLYCPPCRTKKPLSPLKKEISGWRCPFCNKFYKDPDYQKPPEPPKPDLGPHSWMAN